MTAYTAQQHNDLDTIASALGWHDYQTTGSLDIVALAGGDYLTVSDGNHWYLASLAEADTWARNFDGGEPYADFCDDVALVDPLLVLDLDDLSGWDGLCGVGGDIDERIDPNRTYSAYVWAINPREFDGTADLTDDEAGAWVGAAQDYLDDEDLDEIAVHLPPLGEASGIYRVNADRTLQVLGFTIPVPEIINARLDAAADAAAESYTTD